MLLQKYCSIYAVYAAAADASTVTAVAAKKKFSHSCGLLQLHHYCRLSAVCLLLLICKHAAHYVEKRNPSRTAYKIIYRCGAILLGSMPVTL